MSGIEEAGPATRPGSAHVGASAVALAVLGLGLFVLYQAYSIALEQSAYARVGPQVFPYLVGGGLVLIGLLLLRSAVNRVWPVVWAEAAGSEVNRERASWKQLSNVGLVGIGLVVNAAAIAPFGFVVASTLMFALTTRAFGSRRLVFDLAVGALFSGSIFVCFNYLLGLSLPRGTLWSSL